MWGISNRTTNAWARCVVWGVRAISRVVAELYNLLPRARVPSKKVNVTITKKGARAPVRTVRIDAFMPTKHESVFRMKTLAIGGGNFDVAIVPVPRHTQARESEAGCEDFLSAQHCCVGDKFKLMSLACT